MKQPFMRTNNDNCLYWSFEDVCDILLDNTFIKIGNDIII